MTNIALFRREGCVGRCRDQLPRWNNLFLINLLYVASHFSQSLQMCYKRLHALGPESTIAIALEKKEKKILTVNCSELSQHLSLCSIFKSTLPSPTTKHCSTWEQPLPWCILGNDNLDGSNDVFRSMAGIETHSSNFLGCGVFQLSSKCSRVFTPLRPGIHERCLESLLKTLISGPAPRASDSKSRVGLENVHF